MTDFYVQKGHAGSDAGTEADPFLTIDQGFNAITAAGAGPHNIYVQTPVSGSYTELATIDTAGANSAVVAVVGFDVSITENPPVQVVIDGGSVNNYGIINAVGSDTFYHIRNMRVTASTGAGFSAGNGDTMSYFNCTSDNNSEGFEGDNNHTFFQCVAHNNASDGFDTDNDSMLHSCASYANGNDNYSISGGAIVNCMGYGLGGSGDINMLLFSGVPSMVAGCTIDGEGVAGVTGINGQGATNSTSLIVNNIIYDCDAGLNFNGEKGMLAIAGYNLVNSNTADYDGVTPIANTDITTAPQFTDEANDDYTLASGSPAIDAGTDASNTP